MSLGKVIKKYRKIKNMTQEEMASLLGVSGSAVNKWEKEKSLPDITLLAPIARLLNVSLDTLLSFHEELTAEEINQMVSELDIKLKEQSYEEAFLWAKKQIEQYPNCEQLILNIAIYLNGYRILHDILKEEKYDEYICSLYMRLLDSGSVTIN